MMVKEKQKTCEDRVAKHLRGRLDDLRKLWQLYCKGEEETDEELGSIYDYGLCFDYVAPDTFEDQKEGYCRYQLSYGGPSDEFRIYINPDLSAHSIEYWFLDWFDGAHIDLEGSELQLIEEIYQSLFVESGTAQKALEEST